MSSLAAEPRRERSFDCSSGRATPLRAHEPPTAQSGARINLPPRWILSELGSLPIFVFNALAIGISDSLAHPLFIDCSRTNKRRADDWSLRERRLFESPDQDRDRKHGSEWESRLATANWSRAGGVGARPKCELPCVWMGKENGAPALQCVRVRVERDVCPPVGSTLPLCIPVSRYSFPERSNNNQRSLGQAESSRVKSSASPVHGGVCLCEFAPQSHGQ